MSCIRMVSAFGLLLVASTAAQAGSPAAAAPATSVSADVASGLPKLDLGLNEIHYGFKDGQAGDALGLAPAETPADARSPSLAQYLKAPAPYDRFLPQALDQRGAGYRVWF
jgi:hypothetical protein